LTVKTQKTFYDISAADFAKELKEIANEFKRQKLVDKKLTLDSECEMNIAELEKFFENFPVMTAIHFACPLARVFEKHPHFFVQKIDGHLRVPLYLTRLTNPMGVKGEELSLSNLSIYRKKNRNFLAMALFEQAEITSQTESPTVWGLWETTDVQETKTPFFEGILSDFEKSFPWFQKTLFLEKKWVSGSPFVAGGGLFFENWLPSNRHFLFLHSPAGDLSICPWEKRKTVLESPNPILTALKTRFPPFFSEERVVPGAGFSRNWIALLTQISLAEPGISHDFER